jgi:hypothetical protein
MPYELLEQIDQVRTAGHFDSEAETIRQILKVGIFIYTMKNEVKDPEFINKMKAVIKDEKLFDWLETMTTEQLQGIKTASEIVIDGKYKQKKLL